MDDSQIVALYWSRDESAIRETDRVYGRQLHSLSERIVGSFEDAQECVSDTYLKAWNVIPPQRPRFLLAFLSKICRYISLDRFDWNHAAKRRAAIVALTEELELCIPDNRCSWQPEEEILGSRVNDFLKNLPRDSRTIFMRRYWYGDSVEEIARFCGFTQSKVKTQLHRTREKLRVFLEQEGIAV